MHRLHSLHTPWLALLVTSLLVSCEQGGVDSGPYPSSNPNQPAPTNNSTSNPDDPIPYMPPEVIPNSTVGNNNSGWNNTSTGNNTSPGNNFNSTGASVGAACTQDSDCRGYGGCITEPNAPGGYCVTAMCDTLGCEDERDQCLVFPFEDTEVSLCLKGCTTREDCRQGYDCQSANGISICWIEGSPMPGNNNTGNPPGDGLDGSSCTANTDCTGGLCILDVDGWPQGYCSSGCQSDAECNGDDAGSTCTTNLTTGASFCLDNCHSNADCRTGYRCERQGTRDGTCAPNVQIQPGQDLQNLPFNTSCYTPQDGLVFVPYDVFQTTTSYTLVFHGDFSNINPSQEVPSIELFGIERPSGPDLTLGTSDLDFGEDLSQLVDGLPSLALTIPSNPSKTAQLQSGSHRAVIGTNAQKLCAYLVEEDQPGDRIDLNLYFSGAMGLSASSAPDDPNFQRVLQTMHTQLNNSGIQLGKVRMMDLSPALAQTYQAPDVNQLFSMAQDITRSPGYDQYDALSLNIIFVPRFDASLPFLGLSLGIGSPPGLHGTAMSATIASTEYIYQSQQDINNNTIDGGSYMGLTLVHELGHFLGLHHTSEAQFEKNDPLTDTPQCARNTVISDYKACPDVSNAMFPYISHPSPSFTAQQQAVLKASTLTKPSSTELGP